MKTKNSIPKALDEVISLGDTANAGAQAIGDEVPLTINTPAKIATDVHDLNGNPATPLVRGKQAKYVAQKAVVSAAYADGRVVVQAARSFCQLAIDVLAPVFGSRWNSQWNAVGFTAPTLAVPRHPVAMLIKLREYFKMNAAREVAVLRITAVDAQLHLEAVLSATLAIAQARDLLVSMKKARDESLARLRKRLSNLRAELAQVLPANDGRWYDFGFRRPVDGSQPAPVEDVQLTPGGPGFVQVTWTPSALAESYRVLWKPGASSEPPIDAGIFRQARTLLSGLPVGVPLVIKVSARNRSGESAPKEAFLTQDTKVNAPEDKMPTAEQPPLLRS